MGTPTKRVPDWDYPDLPVSRRREEILAAMLLTWHNLHYYQELMQDMRNAIANGGFEMFAAAFAAEQAAGDIDPI
mgnify:CR=1 FL=1